QADVEPIRAAPVELRRTSGPGPRTSREPPECRLEKTGLHQLVQVERRERTRDPSRTRGLVAADVLVAPHHVAVKLPPDRLLEDREARDLIGELLECHEVSPPLAIRIPAR